MIEEDIRRIYNFRSVSLLTKNGIIMLRRVKNFIKWYLKQYSRLYPNGYYPPVL